MITNAVNLNSFSNVVIRNKGILGVKGDAMLDFNTFSPEVFGATNSYLAIESTTNVTYPADWTIDRFTCYLQEITNIPANVTIGTNGVLSHYKNSTAETYKLNLTISGNLTILSNGMITADGLGYIQGYGPGAPGSGTSYGGSHGGTAEGTANTYGSILAPTNQGSGGGYGTGGGVIILTVAGTTTVASAGVITANGVVGSLSASGSGGSVYLTTGWLAGSGILRANGGNDKASGGRMAMVLTGAGADFSDWTGTNTAIGGTSAAAGTVYRKEASAGAGQGTVIVSNSVATAATIMTAVPPGLTPGENLMGLSWLASGYGRLGVTTNVQLGFLTVTGANTRVDLRGNVLSVMPQLNINGALYELGSYGTNDLAGTNVTDSVGGGCIEVRPAVDNAGGATNVTLTSAFLNGNLYAADASSTALFVLWGKQDAGSDAAQWAHTNTWSPPQAAGYFSTNVTAPDLEADTVYYYRFYTTNNARQNIASTSSTFVTTEVTVQSTADAMEGGLVPGTFTFYRNPAATNGPITVNYTISGTAKAGTNYVDDLGSNVTFATGASEVSLTVTPLLDDVSRTDETVILTLTSGSYPIGSPSVVTGLVVNLDIPGAPTNTWTGSGNASQGTNWSLGHAPTNMESIYLSGFSPGNMVWDVTNAVLASWRQTAQYTGTVTFAMVYGASGNTNMTVNGDVEVLGGTWTHAANSSTEANRLRMTIGGNLVMTNTVITADGRGHTPGWGTGAPGAGAYLGGAHGGATIYSGTLNPKTYGAITSPVNLGSGGGYGNGGGAILLTVAGTTTVDSATVITANGTIGLLSGGSGGSIWLTTGWLTGGGTLRAHGGTKAGYGDGSGGRIAMILTGPGADFSLWTGTNTAFSGGGNGAAGTVYRQVPGIGAGGQGTVLVDNRNTATNATFTSLPAFASSAEDIEGTAWVAQNKARVGMQANAVVASLTLNTNSYLELAGYKLTTKSLTITNQLTMPGTYTADQLGVLVSDSSGGFGRVVIPNQGTCIQFR